MPKKERQELIEKLQSLREDRLCVVYVTSTRSGHELSIADDVVRLMYDHFEAGKEKAKKGIDLFIHSNGGEGTVPWRVVSLIREYTEDFTALVPHKAFSAATLLALGAQEIVMHRMGVLGPIDPSVANAFNPPHPQNPGQPLAISVEDVTAYFDLIQHGVGIQHEDELIHAVVALTEKIHPLALGNVQRSHHQARMMAKKLLLQHMPATEEHVIEQIIDNLKSNLFYHGHPINRKEAKEDLGLKVAYAEGELADVMWELYLEYESALKMSEPFQPAHELDLQAAPPTTALTSGGQQTSNKLRLSSLAGAYLESTYDTDVFLTDLDLERVTINTPGGPQEGVKQEPIWQRWEKET